MTGLLLRGAGLAAVYLLVLTSLDPADAAVAAALGIVVAFTVRPHGMRTAGPPSSTPAAARFGAAFVVLGQTAVEMVRGSWRVVRFCLGAASNPGLVEIPRAGRSPINVAMWGVLTGEAPDEVVVHVDEERDVLIVHLVAADDPDAVRARHAQAHERWQRKVVP